MERQPTSGLFSSANIYPTPGSLETDLGLVYCDETGCHQTLDYSHFLFISVFSSNLITKIIV